MEMNLKPSVLQNTIYMAEQICVREEFHSQQTNNLQPGKTLTILRVTLDMLKL